MSKIILTVPHAECIEDEQIALQLNHHTCDYIAPEASITLASIFNFFNIRPAVFTATVNRLYGDMNRPNTRNELFRQRITQAQQSGKTKLVLDVHSFSSISAEIDDTWKDLDLGVMTLGEPKSWHISMIAFLKDVIPQFRIRQITGSQINDIMFVADQAGIPTVLLEFYEELSQYKLTLLCSAIVSFLINYFSLLS